MLSARPWPPLYRDQPVQLDKPDRPLGQRPADTRPRCEFIQAPITSAMSEPFITNDLQDRKLARGEARCDSGVGADRIEWPGAQRNYYPIADLSLCGRCLDHASQKDFRGVS